MAGLRVLCHLIASGFAGGPEKQIIESSPHLSRLGWDVVVGSFRENRPVVEVVENARACGLRTFLIDTKSPFDPRSVVQLRRHLRRYGVDVLVTHGYKPNLVGRLAVSSIGIPQLPIVRGYTAEDWKVRIYEALDRALLRRMPGVLAVSDGMKQRLASYGLDARRIGVIHNAVECSTAVDPVDIAAEFSLPKSARVAVAAGRLSPEKGHRFLIAAMEHLKERLPSLYVIVLGSGREQMKLEAMIADADLEGRVILGGFRRPVLGYLAGADLVVNPSLTEGLPNVVLEAMSVGTPVVATDVGGVPELVIRHKTGWLVPSADPLSLANAIEEALVDTARSAERAAAGRRLMKEAFSFPRQARRMVELLEGTGTFFGTEPARCQAGCGEVMS